MATIKESWEKTAGYKTTFSAVLLSLFEIFQVIAPEAMPDKWQGVTYKAIGIMGTTGIIDKVWRNRKKIKSYIYDIFHK